MPQTNVYSAENPEVTNSEQAIDKLREVMGQDLEILNVVQASHYQSEFPESLPLKYFVITVKGRGQFIITEGGHVSMPDEFWGPMDDE